LDAHNFPSPTAKKQRTQKLKLRPTDQQTSLPSFSSHTLNYY